MDVCVFALYFEIDTLNVWLMSANTLSHQVIKEIGSATHQNI